MDERLQEVARRVPGFGGMFLEEAGQLVVYLVDPMDIPAAEAAIREVFGTELLPPAGMRARPGQFSVEQLVG